MPDLPQPEPPKDFFISHEAAEAFEFFLQLQSYWLHGFAGITGLDHGGVIQRITLFKRQRHEQQWLLQCVEAIESGVLQAWSDQRREADEKNKPSSKQRSEIRERLARRC